MGSVVWIKFGIIVGISVVSVFVRWVAFNRVDSVALELSINSFFLKLFETFANRFLKSYFIRKDVWVCVLLFVFVVVLAILHHILKKDLDNTVKKVIEEAKPHSVNANQIDSLKSSALDCTFPLARHAIFLSFSNFLEQHINQVVRKGKAEARDRYIQLVNALSDGRIAKESDLWLSKNKQVVGLVLFLLIGIASVAVAILS